MGLAKKWLEPGALYFPKLLIIEFGTFFENLKLVFMKPFHLWPQKGPKFSFKNNSFDTQGFLFIAALNESKII